MGSTLWVAHSRGKHGAESVVAGWCLSLSELPYHHHKLAVSPSLIHAITFTYPGLQGGIG